MSDAPTIRTLADLIRKLGVDADRILFHPPPETASEQDVLDLDARKNRLVKLVDGVLVAKAVGFAESLIAQRFAYFLSHFVVPRKLGVVAGSDGMIRLLEGVVRMPMWPTSHTLGQAEFLDGGSVLPEFTLPLNDLFSELDRR